jgi:O-methyltransferase
MNKFLNSTVDLLIKWISFILGWFNVCVTKIPKKYNGVPLDFKFIHSDFDSFQKKVLFDVERFTMTSPERVVSLMESVSYIIKNQIEGDIVECGVWRGGSMMAVINSLIKFDDIHRKLYLFDTFEGMPMPDIDLDFDLNAVNAHDYLNSNFKNENDYIWAYSAENKVREAIYQLNYPSENIIFVKGKVEDTLPYKKLQKIAILRLDTDWYSSTKHELEQLFPLLVSGGVLIIDDYGHWSGARKAVDEYFSNNNINSFFHRIDYTGRILIKK